MIEFYNTKLKNGLEVIGEKHPYGNAVSIGFAVRFGSRDESSENEFGIAHLIEHLVFKQTQKYDSFTIVDLLERKGGDINAFTSKEFTCFHSYGLKEDLKTAVDVLSQLCFYSTWSAEDFYSEKEVIEQEISMSTDTPEDYMYDHFTSLQFSGTSMAHPIFGSLGSLESIELSKTKEVQKKYYQPENMIVSVAGNFDWPELLNYLEEYCPDTSEQSVLDRKFDRVSCKSFLHFEPKQISQAHMILSFPVNAIRDGIHYPISIISNYLSGGMNSKLFQELREKRSLCYSVSASYGPNQQVGTFTVSAATSKDKLLSLFRSVWDILNEIKKHSISQKDLENIIEQIRCGLLLGEADIDARMHSMLFDKVFGREYRSIEMVVDKLKLVSAEDMRSYVDKFFQLDSPAVYFMGNFDEKEMKAVSASISELIS